jgi:uncharacterized membrane protein YraQ (UPF0718 family)/copper chaperone CopZ
MFDVAVQIAVESWAVLGQMSPYLLFGFLVAGILSICVSPEFVERHLGSQGFAPVLKAALFGVPLPLCSCGVIPVAASFRRHGASRAATTSFLLSTPQTGVDSIFATYALMGMTFAVFRPILALATGLLGGLFVLWFVQSNHAAAESDPVRSSPCTDACCAGRGTRNWAVRALEYAFVTLPRDVGVPLLVGVVIAGVISVFVSPNQLQPYLGGGLTAIVLMMLIGAPLYVCATASVPIAAALMSKGASPGAALAFLVAGPATNAATIATVWKLLGRRSVIIYLLTIGLSAVGGGMLLDCWAPDWTPSSSPVSAHCHVEAFGVWGDSLWAAVLLGVLAFSWAKKPKSDAGHTEQPAADESVFESHEQIILSISGMTCSHCAAAAARALKEHPNVVEATVNLSKGQAVVIGHDLDGDRLAAAVNELGYSAKVSTSQR